MKNCFLAKRVRRVSEKPEAKEAQGGKFTNQRGRKKARNRRMDKKEMMKPEERKKEKERWNQI